MENIALNREQVEGRCLLKVETFLWAQIYLQRVG
jgi:hypothetical protein